MGSVLQVLILKELGVKLAMTAKNANLEIHPAEPAGWGAVGVPGLESYVYLLTTVCWRQPFVKGGFWQI